VFHTCDMTASDVWHDSPSECVTRLFQMCEKFHVTRLISRKNKRTKREGSEVRHRKHKMFPVKILRHLFPVTRLISLSLREPHFTLSKKHKKMDKEREKRGASQETTQNVSCKHFMASVSCDTPRFSLSLSVCFFSLKEREMRLS